MLNTCDIVVDVGAVFDAEKKRFDHHQRYIFLHFYTFSVHLLEVQPGLIIFLEIAHEIISAFILSLMLIQKEQLSVTGQSMCASTDYSFMRTKSAQKKSESEFLLVIGLMTFIHQEL